MVLLGEKPLEGFNMIAAVWTGGELYVGNTDEAMNYHEVGNSGYHHRLRELTLEVLEITGLEDYQCLELNLFKVGNDFVIDAPSTVVPPSALSHGVLNCDRLGIETVGELFDRLDFSQYRTASYVGPNWDIVVPRCARDFDFTGDWFDGLPISTPMPGAIRCYAGQGIMNSRVAQSHMDLPKYDKWIPADDGDIWWRLTPNFEKFNLVFEWRLPDEERWRKH